jgi:hypothetical protein
VVVTVSAAERASETRTSMAFLRSQINVGTSTSSLTRYPGTVSSENDEVGQRPRERDLRRCWIASRHRSNVATFAAGETSGESEANGEHSRTSGFVQAGSSRAKAGLRQPDFRVQNEPAEIEKIKSAVCAMHKLLEVTSRKLVSIEGDVGHMRRLLERSGSE